MKKTVVILFFIALIFMLSNQDIPNESIRFRVVASSSSVEDQKNKWEIVTSILPSVLELSGNNISDTRNNISSSLNMLNSTISKYTSNYDINFGYNYFPEKVYNNKTYDAGYYESLVITLGDGLGENFWCVIFPPLCLLEAKSSDDLIYTTKIEEIINSYR